MPTKTSAIVSTVVIFDGTSVLLALVFLLVIVTSIWAAADAAQRDWSELDGPFGLPMGWGWVLVACLAVWIIAFPCYLAERARVPVRQAR